MHEQSETVERNGKWVNVYGRKTAFPGKTLSPKHPFEKPAYDTMQEAVSAAEKRSRLEPDEGDPRSPMWQFERPKSHLPKGVALSPSGDLGLRRGKESLAAGGFKAGKSMNTASYFKKAKRG